MKNILITGANGQLGNEMREAAKHSIHHFLFTDVAELDICDESAVLQFVTDNNIDVIVNCAAYTAVDKAESDADFCYKLNKDAVANLGSAAAKCGTSVIQISTDYVYGGEGYRPYMECDETSPISVYGKSKLDGENILFEKCDNSIVIRTSWLYSTFGNNFVKTMMKLGQEREKLTVIFDQVGTPTYAADLAGAIMTIIDAETFVPGIYNYSNEGVCSWYDFTKTIHKICGITTCQVLPIETSEYPTPAKRPYYSVMNKRKIKDVYGVAIPHWEESVVKCIQKLTK